MTLEYGYFTELFSTQNVQIMKISTYEKSLINNICANTNNFSIYTVHKLKTEATNLFLEISKQLYNGNKRFLKNNPYMPSDDSNILRKYKIELFINGQDCSNKSLKDLADVLGLSPRQTSRFVKDAYGKYIRTLCFP